MGKFWDYISSGKANLNEINQLMEAGENPHELASSSSGEADSALSYLVKKERTEEVFCIINHPKFAETYCVELAYFIRAVQDQILNTDNLVFLTLISEQFKADLQLEEILDTNPEVTQLMAHIRGVLGTHSLAERREHQQSFNLLKAIRQVNLASDGDESLEIDETLNLNEVKSYFPPGQPSGYYTTLLSSMIRKKMDGKVLECLTNPAYQFDSGSVFALRSSVRVKNEVFIRLLLQKLAESQYQFTPEQINEHFEVFLNDAPYVAIAMLNRVPAKAPYQTQIDALCKKLPGIIEMTEQAMTTCSDNPMLLATLTQDMNLYQRVLAANRPTSSRETQAPLLLSDAYANKQFQKLAYTDNAKLVEKIKNIDKVFGNVSEPIEAYVEGGRFAL